MLITLFLLMTALLIFLSTNTKHHRVPFLTDCITLPPAHFLILVFAGIPLCATAADDGTPFQVIGEQLVHLPPAGWKLAWMSGKADASYVMEYIPESEEITSWREGYLAIERINYPSAESLKEIEKYKAKVADIALLQYAKKAKQGCGGQHHEMTHRTITLNGIYFAISGGFCDRYGPAAPFGEGSLLAFVEGKDYLFRIQYGWRPKTAEDQKHDVPWRITQQKAKQYMEAIKATTLCGGLNQPECKNTLKEDSGH